MSNKMNLGEVVKGKWLALVCRAGGKMGAQGREAVAILAFCPSRGPPIRTHKTRPKMTKLRTKYASKQ